MSKSQISDKLIYVYVDYTQEETPRIFYVGKGLKKRTRSIKRNKHHTNIVKKYGVERKVVFETYDNDTACAKEVELIAEHHTFVDDPQHVFGVNYTKGGEGMLGYRFSIESRQQKSLNQCGDKNPFYGKHHTEESNRQNSLNHLGKHHTSQSCLKISSSRCGMKFTQEHKLNMSICVFQYDLQGNFIKKFDSVTLAHEESKASYNGIVQCCKLNPNYQRAGNFMWRYEKLEKILPYHSKGSKRIVQFSKDMQFIRFFNSLNEASKVLKLHRRKIEAACDNGSLLENWIFKKVTNKD